MAVGIHSVTDDRVKLVKLAGSGWGTIYLAFGSWRVKLDTERHEATFAALLFPMACTCLAMLVKGRLEEVWAFASLGLVSFCGILGQQTDLPGSAVGYCDGGREGGEIRLFYSVLILKLCMTTDCMSLLCKMSLFRRQLKILPVCKNAPEGECTVEELGRCLHSFPLSAVCTWILLKNQFLAMFYRQKETSFPQKEKGTRLTPCKSALILQMLPV